MVPTTPKTNHAEVPVPNGCIVGRRGPGRAGPSPFSISPNCTRADRHPNSFDLAGPGPWPAHPTSSAGLAALVRATSRQEKAGFWLVSAQPAAPWQLLDEQRLLTPLPLPPNDIPAIERLIDQKTRSSRVA